MDRSVSRTDQWLVTFNFYSTPNGQFSTECEGDDEDGVLACQGDTT